MAENSNESQKADFTVDDLVALRLMAKDFENIKITLLEMNKKLENNFVSKAEILPFIKRVEEELVERKEFEPIQKIVYGLVGLVLTTVFLAILSVVVTK